MSSSGAAEIATPPAAKPTRTEVRQRQTRVRLREVAYRLMSDQGVDATSIQQITDAANVGFGTFYNYYPSKEALAREVLDCIINNVGRRNDLITSTSARATQCASSPTPAASCCAK